MDCLVCCDKYNLNNRKKITCSYCDYSSCRKCVQSYLISTTQDPHCMSCKKLWNREFMAENCTKLYCSKDYKKHRESVLFEREKALMPSTQEYVSRKIKARAYEKMIEEINAEIHTLYRKRAILVDNVHTLNNTEVPLDGEGEERRKFVRKCPIEECRGFLSTQWKCGVCESNICNKCNEKKEEEHVCNPEAVETMELLKKDTKGCPSCGTMITFIEGCRQMWCPDCHTAFDWKTLRIDTGRIHNPHYYEFKLKTGLSGREHGDIPCGGVPSIQELCGAMNVSHRYLLERQTLNFHHQRMINLHRAIFHIERIEIPWYYNDREIDNRELRASYMMGELSEEDFKKRIQRKERDREKRRDFRNVLTMFIDTSGDLLRQLVMDKNRFFEIHDIISKLISYSGKEMLRISKRYNNCVVPYFSDDWSFHK